jgi:hypothetical protein
MKQYKAISLEQHLDDLSGEPSKKVSKLIDILYIYSQPATPANVKKYLRTDSAPDFELHLETDENGNKVPRGCLFFWDTPIFAETKTIGQFISVATALGRELFWHEDVYKDYIYINSKY